jgi:hypothetical protein
MQKKTSKNLKRRSLLSKILFLFVSSPTHFMRDARSLLKPWINLMNSKSFNGTNLEGVLDSTGDSNGTRLQGNGVGGPVAAFVAAAAEAARSSFAFHWVRVRGGRLHAARLAAKK